MKFTFEGTLDYCEELGGFPTSILNFAENQFVNSEYNHYSIDVLNVDTINIIVDTGNYFICVLQKSYYFTITKYRLCQITSSG